MLMCNENTKPPAQVLGVIGIESMKIADTTIDLIRLISLPPFQQFIVETGKLTYEAAGNPDNYRKNFTEDQVRDLYAEYASWHAAKGYWPNETPMGIEKECKNA